MHPEFEGRLRHSIRGLTKSCLSAARPWASGLVASLALIASYGQLKAIELPPGFRAEILATNLNAATAIAAADDGRLFIAEQTGRVLVWKEGRLLERPVLTLRVTDYWERGLIGLALAPDFARTGHLFVLYVTDQPHVHHVLSRLTLNVDIADPSSELVLLRGDDQARLGGVQPGGHQGGPLRFGLDGNLYVSLGEQTAGEPAQRLDTLQGKILRLNRDGSIPRDNPFFDKTTAKYRAIYALGVRNAFGLAVQPENGRIFFTDVGGSAFEEVNELVAGANYGWPKAEGSSTNAAFKNPLHTYPPLIGQSICGGTFYPRIPAAASKASAFPEKWQGRFFYLDFMKHWLKSLDPDSPSMVMTFARGFNGPVAVETDRDGSLLVLNRGAIWRDPKKFVPNTGSLVRIRYLAESEGASERSKVEPAQFRFAPALGLPSAADSLPRVLTATDWNERVNRNSSRAFWLRDDEWHPIIHGRLRVFLPEVGQVRLGRARDLVYPPGTAILREFLLPLSSPAQGADPAVTVVERRLHVIGAPDGYGVSYRVNPDGTARMIEDGELINLGSHRLAQQGQTRDAEVNWWFPALEPRISHPIVMPSYWIPTTLADWNQPLEESGVNPLAALDQAGGLNGPLDLASIPAGVDWRSPRATTENRVRAYLHANCAVCHQPGGASRGSFDARATTPLEQAGLINAEPAAGDLGLTGAKLVLAGSPEKSILYQRLKRTDFFRMPPIQYHNEPSPILPVMAEWIHSLKTNPVSKRP